MRKLRFAAILLFGASAVILTAHPATAQRQSFVENSSAVKVSDFDSFSASWGDEDDYSRVAGIRDHRSGSASLYLRLAVPYQSSYAYYEAMGRASDVTMRVAQDLSWAVFNGRVSVFHCDGLPSAKCPIGRGYSVAGNLRADGELVKGTQRDAGNMNHFRGRLVTRGTTRLDGVTSNTSYATITRNHTLAPLTVDQALTAPSSETAAPSAKLVDGGNRPFYVAGNASAFTPGYDVSLWAKTYHCVFNGWASVRVNWACSLRTSGGVTLSSHSGSFSNGGYSTPLYYFKTSNTYLCDVAQAGYNDGSASDYDKKCQ